MTAGVKTSPDYPVPETMKAWVLGDPGELTYVDKPVPAPGRAEVLVRIDAVAICATDLEIIYHGPPALIEGGKPHNKNERCKSGSVDRLLPRHRGKVRPKPVVELRGNRGEIPCSLRQ